VKGELATTLARNYQGDFGRYSWLRHSVRPELEYAYISVNQQDDLPGIDNVDALTRTNIFRYGVNNFFWAGGTDSEGSLLQRYIGFLKITQNYDVREARRDTDGPGDKRRPFSDINLTLDTYPLPRWQLKYETDYSVYGEGFTQYNLYSRYTSSRGDKFYLDYRYEKYTEVSEINAAIQARVTDTFYLEGEVRHSFFTDETVRSSIGIVYHPECWAVELRAEDTPDDDRVSLMFSLVGLGEKLGIGLSSDLGEGGLELSSGAGIGEIDFEDFD
jgi:LPS-assembly protein